VDDAAEPEDVHGLRRGVVIEIAIGVLMVHLDLVATEARIYLLDRARAEERHVFDLADDIVTNRGA
jgi:hypothetical protein